MSNIQLQTYNAIIHETSRYGLDHDTVHVEILLNTNEPISTDLQWYVPAGINVPKAVLDIIKASNLQLYPMSSEHLTSGTEDIQNQAKEGNLEEVMKDASKLFLLSVLKKSSLIPLDGSQNLYKLSYDYNLYPDSDGNFELHVQLPFDGLTLNPSGGLVTVTAICPLTCNIDSVFTRGTDINGNEIQEAVTTTNNNNIVTFRYQLDPLFAIKYRY